MLRGPRADRAVCSTLLMVQQGALGSGGGRAEVMNRAPQAAMGMPTAHEPGGFGNWDGESSAYADLVSGAPNDDGIPKEEKPEAVAPTNKREARYELAISPYTKRDCGPPIRSYTHKSNLFQAETRRLGRR